MNFTLLPDTFALVRMGPKDPVPEWADGGPFVSVTRTMNEMSIICLERFVPAGTHADRGWQCLKVDGPIPLTTVGISAEFSTVLARANVSLMPVATYETDYVFVKGDKIATAIDALNRAGHSVRRC